MAYAIKRQLTEQEKEYVLQRHGRQCFASGHPIPDGEPIQFDHIRAFALGGQSEIDNVAPMCATHNREKGTLPLFDFRTKLQLNEFFKSGDRLTLKDLLAYMKAQEDIVDFEQPVDVKEQGDVVQIQSPSRKYTCNLYTCPTTGWKYCYATLDVEVIDSDDERDDAIGLQPRYLIPEKAFDLFRHFQQHPVLQPAIGRIVNNRIRLFDGQHKIAALLWNGRRVFECKVYLSADIRLLNQTNIAAHDKFAQTRFFSSIMVMKLGEQFGQDFTDYRNSEDGNPKSEAGFMSYLLTKDKTATKGELNNRFRSYLYNAILKREGNQISQFVSSGNRSTEEKPLTIDMLSKSLFSALLYREATGENLATESYRRDAEMQNMVVVLNMFYDLALKDWKANAASGDERQRKLDRLFGSKAMMAWSELFGGAVCAKLDLQDADDRAQPLYRDLSEHDLRRIRSVVARLVDWPLWMAPEGHEIDGVLADNKRRVKAWLREKGLTTGYLMGANE